MLLCLMIKIFNNDNDSEDYYCNDDNNSNNNDNIDDDTSVYSGIFILHPIFSGFLPHVSLVQLTIL